MLKEREESMKQEEGSTIRQSNRPCETTNGIKVEVRSHYIPEESQPDYDNYFFVYHVRITNEGQKSAQLLGRKWLITDGYGRREEIVGPGVVGLQPCLRPGEVFEYNSFCPLSTPTGQMEGFYEMENSEGKRFQVKIPELYFIEPSRCH